MDKVKNLIFIIVLWVSCTDICQGVEGCLPRFSRAVSAASQSKIPLKVYYPEEIDLDDMPVTFGVPFPRGALSSANNVRLLKSGSTEVDCMVRSTATWGSSTGDIRWLLIDAGIEKGETYTLEYGTSVSKGSVTSLTVTENTSTITVDTGPLELTFKKDSSELISSAVLGTKTILSSLAQQRMTITDGNDNVATTSNDTADYSIEVEQSGPLHAIIKATGWYKLANGDKLCQYITRVHAYVGQPFVRVVHTFVVAYDTDSVTLKDICVPFILDSMSGSTAYFGLDTDDLTDEYSMTTDGYLLQDDYNDFGVYTSTGKVDGGLYAPGWFGLATSSKGLCIGLRHVWQEYPKELEVADGNKMNIHLWPPHGSSELDWSALGTLGTTLYAAWDDVYSANLYEGGLELYDQAMGAAKTNEFILAFHDSDRASAVSRAMTIEKPVIVSATPEWMCKSDAFGRLCDKILPQASPYDSEELERKIRLRYDTLLPGIDNSEGYGMIHYGDVVGQAGGWRHWASRFYGFPLLPWIMFARTGEPQYLMFAMDNARHVMDIDMCHIDDENYGDYSNYGWSIPDIPGKWKGGRYGGNGGIIHYGAHVYPQSADSHVDQWTYAYYLTGYRRAWDVLNEEGQFYLNPSKLSWEASLNRYADRGSGAGLRTYISLYRATWDTDYLDAADTIADFCYSAAAADPDGVIRFDDTYMSTGMFTYYQITGDTDMKDLFLDCADAALEDDPDYPLDTDARFYRFHALSTAYFLTGDTSYLEFPEIWKNDFWESADDLTGYVRNTVLLNYLPFYLEAINSQMAAHWKFDEGTGSTAGDSVNSYDGTVNGASWATGKIKGALSFDGTDDYINCGDEIFTSGGEITTDDFTIVCWVKTSTSGNQYVLSKGVTSTNRIYLNVQPNYILLSARSSGTDIVCFGSTSTGVNSGEWTHLAMVAPRGGTPVMYINGVSQTLTHSTCNTGDISNSGDLYIGKFDTGCFNGLIDELAVYNRALSEENINSLYFFKKAQWKFDEDKGQIAYDSLNEYDGAVDGAAWSTEGKVGGCLSFDGTDDYVDCGGTLQSSLGTSYSVEAWINTDTVSENNIIASYRSTISSQPILFQLEQDDADIKFTVRDDSGTSATATVTDVLFADDTWYHVIGVRDGSTLNIYVDGVQGTSGSASFGAISPNKYLIGAGVSGSTSPSNHFDGLIDNVKVYDRALSADDVAQISLYKSTAAYWEFDELSGSIAYDSTNVYDGDVYGGSWVSGEVDGALSFDGVDDYVDCGDVIFTDGGEITTDNFTIACWVKTSVSGSNQYVLGKGVDSSNKIYLNVQTNYTLFSAKANGTDIVLCGNTSIGVDSGEWTHLAIVAPRGGTPVMYINGVSQTLTHSICNTGDISNNAALSIGKFMTSGHFDGEIDDLRIYNRALRQDEVLNLCSNTFHWTFDEGTGSTACESINGYDGTISGASWTTGEIEGALSFDGTDDYVDCGDVIFADGGEITSEDFTVACWVKTSVSGTNQYVLGKGVNSNNKIYLNVQTNYTLFSAKVDGADVVICGNTSIGVDSGEWTHLAIVAPRGGTPVMYINGVSQTLTHSVCNTGDISNSGNLCIGKLITSGYFDGEIDEVIIYDRALSAGEVADLCN